LFTVSVMQACAVLMGAEPIRTLFDCAYSIFVSDRWLQGLGPVSSGRRCEKHVIVLSLLKTNCSPITKPKPRYSQSGSPIPLQDISTCHERLFFFSLSITQEPASPQRAVLSQMLSLCRTTALSLLLPTPSFLDDSACETSSSTT